LFKQAYISICDLLVVFCNQLGVKHYPVLGNLIYDSDKELQDLLNNFIQKNVFVYEEEGDLYIGCSQIYLILNYILRLININ